MNDITHHFTLEVIACSVTDAIAAERGGADRLEIITDFGKGGMTPPVEIVLEISSAVGIPLRVMIRETEEFTVTDRTIIEKLCQSARALSQLRTDGLVLGFVSDGRIDVELTNHVLSFAPYLKATFHHAFEELDNPLQAIRDLKRCPQIDRILTYGGRGKWDEKIEWLAEYQRAAAPEITILAGGGLDRQIIERIRRETDVREFHVGRTVRTPSTVDGKIKSSLVSEIVSSLRADKVI
jgi:copper homeostasis protein